MRRPISLLAVIVIGVALFLCGCGMRRPAVALRPWVSFEATNIDLGDGSPAVMVRFTNGLSLAVGENKVTLYFQPSNTLTAWFDPQTKGLLKTLLEIPAVGNRPAQWVRDINADGVPDLRKIKGGGAEVFYDGRWYPCKPAGGTNTLIVFQGREVALHLDGGFWKVAPAAK